MIVIKKNTAFVIILLIYIFSGLTMNTNINMIENVIAMQLFLDFLEYCIKDCSFVFMLY